MAAEFPALLGAFTAAVESGDGQRLAALFTADGVYNDGFYGSSVGRDAIAAMLENHFHAHARDFRWRMHNPVCDGTTGYANWDFSYTSKLPGAAGSASCSRACRASTSARTG
jgi:ketosteroid isomerase-like protein